MVSPLLLVQVLISGRRRRDNDQQHQLGTMGDAESGRLPSQEGQDVVEEDSRISRLSRLSRPPLRTSSPEPLHPEDSPRARGRGSREEDSNRDGIDTDEEAAAGDDSDEDDEDHDSERPNGTQVAFHPDNSDFKPRSLRRMPRIPTTSSMSSWLPTSRTPGPFGRGVRKVRDFVFQKGPGPESDSQFIPNYRYLPILSGVLSPFAILLEIPGLTEHWYIRTEGNQTVEFRANPPLLDAAMAISMGCGVVANVALIVRFLENRVKLMTYICMAFLIFHDIINVVTVTIFGIIHRFDDGFTYGEAFWMCIVSTLFSVIVTGTLFFDLYTTPEFAKSGSGLTRKQRSLVIMVMILICYAALGSLVFAEIMDLTFQDGLYFTVVSIETIGFGDIFPKNTGSSIFCVIYTTIGVINVGLVVNTTRETIIEAFENAYRKRSSELAHRRHENKISKQKKRAQRKAIEEELRAAGLPVYIHAHENQRSATGGGRGGAGHHHVMQPKLVLNEKGLEEWKRKIAQEDPSDSTRQSDDPTVVNEVSLEPLTSGGLKIQTSNSAGIYTGNLASNAEPNHVEEAETYAEFRTKMAKEEQREFLTKLSVAWMLFLTFWLIGAAIFMKTEGWGFGTALYFCWMSFSTIGYGEITPSTPAGRAIFVAWALMGVAAMTILIAVISEAYSSRYKSVLERGTLKNAIKNFEGKQHERVASPHGSVHDEELVMDEGLSALELARNILQTTQTSLDPVPHHVLKHANTFHDYIRYFGNNSASQPPPAGLSQLLDEIAESEKLDDRLKQEMLGDDDARKALFFITYERAFRRMVETAQRAVEVVAFKDAELQQLIAILEQEENRRGRSRLRSSSTAVQSPLDGKKMARFTPEDPSSTQQAVMRQRTLPAKLDIEEQA